MMPRDLSFEGHRRLVRRCQYRPIAHIAAEAAVSRQCLSKWVARWREHGNEDHPGSGKEGDRGRGRLVLVGLGVGQPCQCGRCPALGE